MSLQEIDLGTSFEFDGLSNANNEDVLPSSTIRDDPALHDQFSLMRARFSGQPGFTLGTETPHPITSAEQSLLAQPEIAEALEAVYLETSVCTNGNRQNGHQPLDMSLALSGLVRLKSELKPNDDARLLRRNVADATRGVRHKKGRTDLPPIIAASTNGGTPDKKQAKDEVDDDIAEYRKTYEQQLAQAVELATELDPDIEIEEVVDMLEMLSPKKDSDGRVVVHSDGQFERCIDKRAEKYLDSPEEYTKDSYALFMIAHASKMTAGNHGRELEPYLTQFALGTDLAFRAKTYSPGKFTRASVERWRQAVGLFDADIHESEQKEEVINQKKYAGEATLLSARDLFSHSIELISRTAPDKLVSSLYTLAEADFYPDRILRHDDIALHAIGNSLHDNPAIRVILSQTGMLSKKDKLREKAIDLFATLQVLDPGACMVNDVAHGISQSAKKQLRRTLKKLSIAAVSGQVATIEESFLREMERFAKRLETPEGKDSTIYGRFDFPAPAPTKVYINSLRR
jgi:hypothetical protein